jgi:glutamate/tyrosine decarboxylase-like PLP-dependent enzyme
VIHWIKEMLGYPAEASGLLTSGCSAANLIGLAVARNSRARCDVRTEGLGAAPRRMVTYASREVHSSVQKAVELLGLGGASLHIVAVNGAFEIDVDALRAMIARDRDAGLEPFCVVGAAGTTNTGAMDDLDALADVCEQEGLWYHVDGAFGAWAGITPRESGKVAGMERADSLAVDLHKWMYMPYEIGCVLVRSEEAHREAFALTPDYLAHGEGGRGLTGGDLPWFSDYGLQLSRGFRALKAWMSLKTYGQQKLGRVIQKNIDQARCLAELVRSTPELEMVTPVALNIVCFRYVAPGLDEQALNRLNERIVVEVQETGVAVPSGTLVGDRYAVRASITNHRTRREDLDLLVREVVRVGGELAGSAA